MLGAHEQDGLDDRLSLDGSSATCIRHVVPPHTPSSPQYAEYLPTYMGSPMKMIMRNLFKVSQTWSTIADALRWEASACELCITPRCFVSCCVSQPLCITHPLCIVYCTCVRHTAVYITLSHLSWSTPGCAQDGYGADMRRSREQTSSAYSILITLVAVD